MHAFRGVRGMRFFFERLGAFGSLSFGLRVYGSLTLGFYSANTSLSSSRYGQPTGPDTNADGTILTVIYQILYSSTSSTLNFLPLTFTT